LDKNGPTPFFAKKIPEVVDLQWLTETMWAGKYVNNAKNEAFLRRDWRTSEIRHRTGIGSVA